MFSITSSAGSDLEVMRYAFGAVLETPFATLLPPMLVYCSFLVRCWTKPDGKLWVQAEQVQTGEQFKGADLLGLTQWMESIRQRMVASPEIDPGEEREEPE